MQWTSEELPCHQEMHDLAEQSRSPSLNHQSHLCTHKHPPGGYNYPHPFPSHIILHFKEQQDCRHHEEEEEEEEVPMDYHHLTCTACLLYYRCCMLQETKKQKKQCMVVEDTIHHSRNGWGWGKEERKEGRKKKKVPEEWASNRFAAENRAGSIIAKQADLWEHRILLVPYTNPKP